MKKIISNANIGLVILFLILFVAISECGVGSFIRFSVDQQHQMLELNREEAFDVMVSAVARSQAPYKVIWTGGSQVFGDLLKINNEDNWKAKTIPALYTSNLPDGAAYWNMAINGSLPTDIYAIIDQVIAAKPDIFVFNLDYHFPRNRALKQDILFHPYLMKRISNVEVRDSLQELFEEMEDGSSSSEHLLSGYQLDVEEWLASGVAHLELFKNRSVVQQLMFGSTTQDFAYELPNYVGQQKNNTVGAEEANLFRVRRLFAAKEISDDDIYLEFCRLIKDRLQEAKIPVVVLMAPHNQKFLEQFEGREEWYKNLKKVRDVFDNTNGVLYLDYFDAIDSEHFYDYTHLKYSGNLIVVDKLKKDMDQFIQNSWRRK